MKLTAREKFMLLLLGVVSVLLAIYYLLWEPQMIMIQNLENEREAYAVQLSQNQKLISSSDAEGHTEYIEIKKKIDEKTQKFFPVISEEKIIVLLDALFADTGIQVEATNFSEYQMTSLKPQTVSQEQEVSSLRELVSQYYDMLDEMMGSKQDEEDENLDPEKNQSVDKEIAIESMSVTFQYSASYKQLMDFILSVEGLNRMIVFDELTISQTVGDSKQISSDQLLSGTIVMTFYAIPKITDQDADYTAWPYQRQYGTDNPFVR